MKFWSGQLVYANMASGTFQSFVPIANVPGYTGHTEPGNGGKVATDSRIESEGLSKIVNLPRSDIEERHHGKFDEFYRVADRDNTGMDEYPRGSCGGTIVI
jgi:hypothetical protein